MYYVLNRQKEVSILTLGDLIKKYREETKSSMDDFAEKSGLSKGYISMLEKNLNPKTGLPIAPSLQTIKQASIGMNMDFETVLTMIDQDVDLDPDPFANYPELMPIKKKSFPMLGEIACGEPTFADQQHNTYMEADGTINADFCLRCKGESMIGDGINDGDIIFIRKQDIVENGEIACVIIDDSATLKHVYLSDDNITLIASNPSVPPMVYGEHDAGTIKILGKAVALTRSL
ncbi:MAG: helix-turn-helix domain-containing protein [Firmicutes bacterium]|nr:helix-turn-helix domain-containing protein [Bacillota bacterium]